MAPDDIACAALAVAFRMYDKLNGSKQISKSTVSDEVTNVVNANRHRNEISEISSFLQLNTEAVFITAQLMTTFSAKLIR